MQLSSKKVLFDILRPKQNGHYFAANIFKLISISYRVGSFIPIQITLKLVPCIPVNNKVTLVQLIFFSFKWINTT